MSTSIIVQLAKKDFMLTRKIILVCCLISLTSIGIFSALFGRIPNWILVNVAFTLLAVPAATCGIILLMTTNVFEKEKFTQAFIMSLPVTVREFTLAKLLVNLSVFSSIWLVITAVAFYFSFVRGMLPLGTLPFLTMVFLGVFVAYICILSASLIFQSQGITVLAIMGFEMITSAYLWVIVFLDPIANHVYGPNAIWNSTGVAIVMVQALVAAFVILATLFIQNKKRDFL